MFRITYNILWAIQNIAVKILRVIIKTLFQRINTELNHVIKKTLPLDSNWDKCDQLFKEIRRKNIEKVLMHVQGFLEFVECQDVSL